METVSRFASWKCHASSHRDTFHARSDVCALDDDSRTPAPQRAPTLLQASALPLVASARLKLRSRAMRIQEKHHAQPDRTSLPAGVQRMRCRVPSVRDSLPSGARPQTDGALYCVGPGMCRHLPTCRCINCQRRRTHERHLRALRAGMPRLRNRVRHAQHGPLQTLR